MVNYSLTSVRRPLDHHRPQPRSPLGKKPLKMSGGARTGATGGGFSLLQLGQRLVWWVGVAVGLVGVAWIASLWLRGQLGKFWPLERSVLLVVVDPQPGSVTGPWLMQLQPDTKTVAMLALSADQNTELFSGYGEYKLPAVYPLLNLDRRSQAYVRATFSAVSKALVTDVIPWAGLPVWQSEVRKTGVLATASATSTARRQAEKIGDEPLAYLTKMYWEKAWLKDVKWSDRIQNLKALKQTWQWRWFAEQTDVRWVWTTDRKMLLATSDETADQCPLAVVNATDVKGLARQISEVLTANGYTTVRTTVDSKPGEQSHVWLDPEAIGACQSIAEHVATLLPTGPQPELHNEIPKLYRAPIVIVVGADITK